MESLESCFGKPVDICERRPPWGAKENYHLCINTTGKEIKDLVPTAAAFAQAWFR